MNTILYQLSLSGVHLFILLPIYQLQIHSSTQGPGGVYVKKRVDTISVLIELLFVFVEAVFVAPRSEELGIAT